MIKLTITEKGGEPKSLSFDKDEISIGRVTGNDIVLPKGNVSKRHSKIARREGVLEVSDLKSTNGTYVNGRKIADPVHVTGADKIYVGDFMIILEGEAAAAVGNGHNEAVSASRRLPVPPPPPPPARGGASLAHDADEGEADDAGESSSEEDDESLGLAVRPPRAGRMPPPPPPPRRTPIGTAALESLDEDGGAGASSRAAAPSEIDAGSEETGAQGGGGLFEHGPTRATIGDDDDDEGEAFKEAPVTGSRAPRATSRHATVEPPARPPTPPGRAPGDSGPTSAPERSGRNAGATDTTSDARVAEALDKLLADTSISAIFLRGPEPTLVERHGKIETYSASFGDLNAVADVVWRLATTAIPPPAADNPVVDVRLVDGTRIAAAFPPAAPAGICAVIRKPVLPDRTLGELNPGGVTPSEVQVVLDSAVKGVRNVLVTGDSAAVGVVLGALASAIPAERSVVSVGAGLGRARAGWTELAASADMSGLVRVAAAFRADHLLMAEAAGPEVLDILLCAARGQEGLIFGLPARSATEALARIEALAARTGAGSGLGQLAGSSLDLIVFAVSLPGGGVRIAEIAEVRTGEGGKAVLAPALLWRSDGGPRSGSGVLDVVGVSARLADAMAARGSSLPSNLVRRADA
jgi:pilus assembly protein CpaF